MANHKSAVKRIRQTKTRNAKNRLQHKTTRNAIKSLKETTSKFDNSNIPKNTLRLIEEAEKSKN